MENTSINGRVGYDTSVDTTEQKIQKELIEITLDYEKNQRDAKGSAIDLAVNAIIILDRVDMKDSITNLIETRAID